MVRQQQKPGIRDLPITQPGFVRLSSNATVFPKPASTWSALITDAYLIGLAEAHAGKLATLNSKIFQLAPDIVEMIV